MNSIKKHPHHFSLNLGKLLNDDNGQNPHIIYYKFPEIITSNVLNIDASLSQEFVIDCGNLDQTDTLYNFLDRIRAILKEKFIIRTIIVKNAKFSDVLAHFINNIRIIESTNLNALTGFPDYKIRLACHDFKSLYDAAGKIYYIYRNPKEEEMALNFEHIKTVKTDIYTISYYRKKIFIYSVYKQNKLRR